MRFLVGVDGSEPSRRACEFAAELANASGAQVKVVFVRHVPATTGLATGAVGLMAEALDEQEAAVKEIVDSTLKDGPGYWTTETKDGGDIGAAIDTAAQDWGADLIIVGSRGYHGAHRLLAGSVSTELVHRAHLPVLVVR
jgi:nucleotide-binding universal stress UspA family protein